VQKRLFALVRRYLSITVITRYKTLWHVDSKWGNYTEGAAIVG